MSAKPLHFLGYSLVWCFTAPSAVLRVSVPPWWKFSLLPLPRRRNRLFQRRGHVSVFGHHVRGLRHVRLAPQPCAHRLAVGHRGPAFTPYRHSFIGPAVRRGHGNAEIARNRRPALEFATDRGLRSFFGKFLFHEGSLRRLPQLQSLPHRQLEIVLHLKLFHLQSPNCQLSDFQ
jgi:hypothetical protein